MSSTEFVLIDRERGPRVVRYSLAGPRVDRGFGRPEGPWIWKHQIFADADAALLDTRTTIARLQAKGYELGVHDPRLISMIEAAPEDPSNYLVYADWLVGEGDPRGELIQLMFALEQQPNDPNLVARLDQLRSEHALRFENPAWAALELEWRWGFVEGLRIDSIPPAALLPDSLGYYHHHVEQGLSSLRNHPSGRFVRYAWVGERSYEASFIARGRWSLTRIA